MDDMKHLELIQKAVHALNMAVDAAANDGLTVEHQIIQFESVAHEARPQIETTISRRLVLPTR